MNIQEELSKIHSQFGTSEMANYKIQQLFEEQLTRVRKEIIVENPIVSNRIVADKTFATRLQSFLKDIKCNDPMSEEELFYLRNVTKSLLLYQKYTVSDRDEKKYLDMCHTE
jgi:hypothetical protein